MKTRKTLALFAFALLSLGLTAQKAQATSYTCQEGGNEIPATVSGPATVTETGNCTIGHAVTVSGGDLTITAGGNISAQAITVSTGGLQTTSSGNTTLNGAVSVAGNMILQSSDDFEAGSTLSASLGGIEIDAQTGGGNDLFTIGSGTSNGIATSISAHNGVYIVNGTSTSTGGITIADGSDINVNPQGGRAGLFLINAQNGTLTLSAGTLSSDGAAGQDAGYMILLANTVVAGDSTTMTASQSTGAPSNNAPVGIAATTITVEGTTGLAIHADDGSSSSGAQVSINPQGWLSIASTEDLDSLGWTISVTGTQNAPLTFNGTGNLTMTSNGASSQVQIGGYPITFSNGAVTAQSKWDSSTFVNIGNPSPYSGSTGVAFNNSGDVTLDASATQTNSGGGQVWLFMDQFSTTSATSFVVHADGNGSGAGGTVDFFPSTVSFSSSTETLTVSADSTTGNGGTVNFDPNGTTMIDSATVSLSANGVGGTMNFQPNNTTTIDSTTFTVAANAPSSGGNAGIVTFNGNPFSLGGSSNPMASANGPTSGTGNGGTINFGPGFLQSISLGGNAGDISLSATGGSTSGNGGTIVVNNAPSLTLDSTQATALNVSAPGSTGDGGTITISDWTFTANGSGYALDADAGTSQGNGGTITINGAGTVIGSGAGALEISANGAGTGNGGQISVTAQPLTVDGASISANAGSTNGNGGQLTLNSDGGTGELTITGTLSADGVGSGNGGQISLQSILTMNLNNSTVSANGGPSGNGGTISVTSTDSSTDLDLISTTMTAKGGTTSGGNGGSISVVAGANIDVDADSTLDASAEAGNSSGGNITIEAAQGESANISVEGSIQANGASDGADGNGGTIVFTYTEGTSGSDTEFEGATCPSGAKSGRNRAAGVV